MATPPHPDDLILTPAQAVPSPEGSARAQPAPRPAGRRAWTPRCWRRSAGSPTAPAACRGSKRSSRR